MILYVSRYVYERTCTRALNFGAYRILCKITNKNGLGDVSSKAIGLEFGLRLHLCPYFMYASSKGSGESQTCPNLYF